MKLLYLIRHAKSDWSDPRLSDFDRPLNQRGWKNAPFMGKQLALEGTIPDLILSSPALRAKTTAQEMAKQLSYPVESIVYHETLYASDPQRILSIIRSVPDEIETLFLFGHNPELTECANLIADCDIDNIPTCGIVSLALNQENWGSIGAHSAKLHHFDFPKKPR
ncbi:MAG: histidine phosphatase family protein [Sulfuricurvum sp.]|nr:histidine phosphatase family protein [Sulfuricurvum sp.]